MTTYPIDTWDSIYGLQGTSELASVVYLHLCVVYTKQTKLSK